MGEYEERGMTRPELVRIQKTRITHVYKPPTYIIYGQAENIWTPKYVRAKRLIDPEGIMRADMGLDPVLKMRA